MPLTPPRRRLSADARRRHLLDVAVELAAGGDVGAVSVAEIATAAGVSEGLLYHYFPTKQALVVAALRRAADAFLADLEAVAGGPPGEGLVAGLTAYLDHVERSPVGWLALLRATGGDVAAITGDVERRSRALTLRLLGVDTPGPGLLVALAGWEAFERAACAAWLDHRALARPALEELLAASFAAALTAAAVHDPTAASALRTLSDGD